MPCTAERVPLNTRPVTTITYELFRVCGRCGDDEPDTCPCGDQQPETITQLEVYAEIRNLSWGGAS